MRRFVYTGNTEAGCYLGGIVILPYTHPHPNPYVKKRSLPPIGPLCGEVGRLIFEDERLDGLTLGSYRADIIIFLFSGQSSTLELDIIFSNDKCEGIPNVLDYFPSGESYHLNYADVHLGYDRWFELTVSLSLTQAETQACVKMQNFIDSVFSDSFTLERSITKYSETYLQRYSVDIKMACYKRDCFDPFWWMIIHSSCVRDFFLELSQPDRTFTADSFSLPGGGCDIRSKLSTGCTPIHDRVVIMTFQSTGEQCSNMKTYDPYLYIGAMLFHRRPVVSVDKCSSATFALSDGLYGTKFLWYTYLQLNIHISISPVLKQCTAQDIYVILYRYYIDSFPGPTSKEGATDMWKLEQNTFAWTMWDNGDDGPLYYELKNKMYSTANIELYVLVKSQSHTNMTQHPNISSCNQTMHIKYHHENFPYDIKTINTIRSMSKWRYNIVQRDGVYCLLSTCYFLYPWRKNVSWNSVQIFCQQRNMQLPTMNADIKAQYIQGILYGYMTSFFLRNPILFLNMKQANKVCTT